MEIIKQRELHEEVSYNRQFDWRGETGSGFGFPCDKDGNVGELTPEGAENYQKCIDGTHDVIDRGVQKYEHSWWEAAIGKCDCGAEIEMVEHGMSGIDCQCGAIYNSGGQRLAPRSHWGEETGEQLSDIMRGGDPFDE